VQRAEARHVACGSSRLHERAQEKLTCERQRSRDDDSDRRAPRQDKTSAALRNENPYRSDDADQGLSEEQPSRNLAGLRTFQQCEQSRRNEPADGQQTARPKRQEDGGEAICDH